MDDERRRRLSWLAANLFPHEKELTGWLRRSLSLDAEVQDIVQESYCRIFATPNLERIANARAYFYQVARNVAVDQLRRVRVVRIDTVADVDSLSTWDEQPSAERVASARQELRQVQAFIEQLPERCRAVLIMRKIEQLPQKEIARRLGISENVVENEAARAIRLLLDMFAKPAKAGDGARRLASRGGRRVRQRD